MKESAIPEAGIVVAYDGTTVVDLPDRIPLDVLDTIQSGWQLPSGPLHEVLRGKKLVYVVHAINWVGQLPGAFYVYAAGRPQDMVQIKDVILDIMSKASKSTPTQQDVDLAVNTILTAELLDNQSMSALALQSSLDELYGLGWNFRRKMEKLYRQVTPADVSRVAKKYLSAEPAIYVTTSDKQLLEGKSK